MKYVLLNIINAVIEEVVSASFPVILAYSFYPERRGDK
jgi:hypothetical protein